MERETQGPTGALPRGGMFGTRGRPRPSVSTESEDDSLDGGAAGDLLSDAPAPPKTPARGLIPSNIRVFAGSLLGSGSTITEGDLSKSDLQAVTAAVRSVGGSKGVIGYGDYAGQIALDPQMGVVDLLGSSFSDPAFRMETTLGMARFEKNNKGETIVTDVYNFAATQKRVEAAQERGKLHTLLEAYEKAGSLGFLNALANLSGLGSEGRSRKVRINLGKID